jgi:fibronectin-binding autotransporter adhesin
MGRRSCHRQLGRRSNWNPNSVPISGANVTFSGTVQTVIDLQSNRTVGTLNFNATADPFTLNNFTLTPNAITNNSFNNQTIQSTIQLTGNRTFTAVTAPLTYQGNILLSNNATNRTLTLTGASNHIINGTITNGLSPASNLTKTGSGTLILTANNTYSGNTTLTAGTLALDNNNALGTSTLILNGGTLTAHSSAVTLSNDATVAANSTIAGAHAITINGTTTINGTRTLFINNAAHTALNHINLNGNLTLNSTGTLSFNGTTTLNNNRTITNNLASLTLNQVALSNNAINRTLTIGGTGDTTISGAITNGLSTASNLTKTDSGTLTLSGNSANTYTGNTVVNSGTLILNKNAGTNAITGNLNIQSGGTLLLAQSNQINNTSNLTLAGGTFNTQGNSEALGTLTLTASSTIDLGSGNSILQFANSAAPPWNVSAQLLIQNWSGLLTGGGTDQIYFGNNASGLTPSKLSQIQFVNPAGLLPGTYGAQILSTGEIVPIPEPGALLTVALLLILCLFQMQKKKRP